jgi:hypothetical protein
LYFSESSKRDSLSQSKVENTLDTGIPVGQTFLMC